MKPRLPACRHRQPPTAGPSSYDPHSRALTLAPDATPYQLAHEKAHAAQHEYRTLIWRIHVAIPRWVPYLARVTNLVVEWEAKRLALATLALCGRLNRAATAEASRSLWTYFLALLLIPTPAEVGIGEVTSPATARRLRNRLRQRPGPQDPLALPELIEKAAETGQEPIHRGPLKNPNGAIAGHVSDRP